MSVVRIFFVVVVSMAPMMVTVPVTVVLAIAVAIVGVVLPSLGVPLSVVGR